MGAKNGVRDDLRKWGKWQETREERPKVVGHTQKGGKNRPVWEMVPEKGRLRRLLRYVGD